MSEAPYCGVPHRALGFDLVQSELILCFLSHCMPGSYRYHSFTAKKTHGENIWFLWLKHKLSDLAPFFEKSFSIMFIYCSPIKVLNAFLKMNCFVLKLGEV